MKTSLTIFLIILLSTMLKAFPKSIPDSSDIHRLEIDTANQELHGVVLDMENQTAMPYANIFVLHKNKGTITNEKGHFTLNISELDDTDTLRFQYIGYKTRKITLAQMDTVSIVYLNEEIINLSEMVIFGSIPNLNKIVKNVLVYRDSNYRKTTSKRQTFIREREIADISDFQLKYKKSSIDELDRETIKTIEERTPDLVTSYTDFLGHYYYNKNRDDSIRQKVDPIRMVTLKEEYLDDLKQLETLFEGILASTGEDEYWKVKSGIFGQKIDFEEDIDSTELESPTDTRRKASSYGRQINYMMSYSSLNDKDQWEFLHKTGKYKYTLLGGTRVNGEDVYIIDFVPNEGGMYEGRMYVTRNTYALIRADYEYAPGKTGRDIHLLGIGYTETQFGGSIYFEKQGDYYLLKYFSNRTGYTASIDRSLALLKKKKRWLFDKKVNELKIRLDMVAKAEESVEFLVLDETEISKDQFISFDGPEYIEIISVDQFDDNLWRGYSIIEPTQQMKEYKKQGLN